MINLRNLRNFDLNGLPLFFSVFKHSSITKAAMELETSPSNVTQGINKLRKHFNDPLFVRVGMGIEPTIFCTQLHAALLSSFSEMCGSMFSEDAKEEIVIYSPDGPMFDFIDKYSKAEGTETLPKITHISQVVDSNTALELFSFRKADIVITHEKTVSPGIISTKLYTMRVFIAFGNQHPQREALSDVHNNDKAMLEQPWVTVNNSFAYYQSIRKNNEAISKIIRKRKKVVFESSSQFLNLLFIEKNNAIGVLSELVYKNMNKAWRESISLIPSPEIELDVYINYKTSAKKLMPIIDIFKGKA
ncbi:LysR family transcriptional regulator [Enterobacteriaceae bacterium RIT691]|nr:LysR family transcriptional regulator [Enterobacteriaceae bacterium RIT691]